MTPNISEAERERNLGILGRIARVDGADLAELGIHPDLMLRADDDIEMIRESVRITSEGRSNVGVSMPSNTPKDRELSPELQAGLA